MNNYAALIRHSVTDLEWALYGKDVLLSQNYANKGDIKMAREKMREALSLSKVNGYDTLRDIVTENAYFLVDKSDECDN